MKKLIVTLFLTVFYSQLYAETLSVNKSYNLYNNWLKQYQSDYRRFIQQGRQGKIRQLSDIKQIFNRSTADKSGVRTLIWQSCMGENGFHCDAGKHYSALPDAMLLIYRNSKPVHIVVTDKTYIYLKPQGRLASLLRTGAKLKKDGTLERNIMPFASFKVEQGRIRAINISKEFYQVASALQGHVSD